MELALLTFLKAITGDDCCGVTFPLSPLTDAALAECRLMISRLPFVAVLQLFFDCPNLQ